jgi:NAD(P)-dependent dehydrogenase (short-subunit alcohol dehydrogenase family)
MEITQEFAGKVALITGASSNMGRQAAEALAARGAKVVVHYHAAASRAKADETVAAIQALGSQAVVAQADLTQPAQVKQLFQTAKAAWGRLDIVLNTAGVMVKKPLAEVTEAEFDLMFAVHTKAAFFVLQEAAQHLEDQGRILNISTSLTSVTTGLYALYAGAKAAAEQFTKMLAKEVGERGITVNSVAPGPLNTSFFYPVESEQSVDYLKHMSVAGRLGEIEDVVPVLLFLASPAAHWVTAQTIRVNGGMV